MTRGVARARRLGLATTVYTVNDERRMRQVLALGVDGIFSDRPALLREVVSSPARAPAQAPAPARSPG